MKACIICGAMIPPERTSNNLKYCSEKCARKAEADKHKKAIAYRAVRHNPLALKVYRAYGRKCAICQWQATEETISYRGKIQYAHGNEIHHITPISEGGGDNWENVILLCPNHHKQADMGILSREALEAYTKPYEMTEEEKAEAKSAVADTIAALIFD